MRHRHGDQRLRDMFNRRAQPVAGFIDPGEHRGLRQFQGKQLGNELRAACQRQQLAVGQMHRQCAHVRAVLHNFGDAIGKGALVYRAAGATQLPCAMFGDVVARHRNVEHLPTLMNPRLGCIQGRSARAMLR